TGGERPPLFCTHGAGANVLCFEELARHLPPDQPFYGLQSPGLDGTTPPVQQVEEMAAWYVDEIRAVQAHGPYYLAGCSMGGVVAFEMAQQLVAAGEEVAFLGLLDTTCPGQREYGPARSFLFRHRIDPFVASLEERYEELKQLGLRGFLPRELDRWRK